MATLPHFLTLPSPIAASSDIALALFSLYPENFLLTFLECTCPQGSAFCHSPTVKLCSSFSTTELILLFLQLSTSSKMFISNGLWPIVFGYPTFNEICPIPNLSPSPQSKNLFYFLSSNIYIHVLIITDLKSFCLHNQCNLHNQLSWGHINNLLPVSSLPFPSLMHQHRLTAQEPRITIQPPNSGSLKV